MDRAQPHLTHLHQKAPDSLTSWLSAAYSPKRLHAAGSVCVAGPFSAVGDYLKEKRSVCESR